MMEELVEIPADGAVGGVMDGAAWYCLRTQTKRETLAAASLREMGGIEVLSPRLRYKKATRRGKVWWVEALFPGYILARFNLDKQERAVGYASGVTRILRFGGLAPTIREDFVEELKAQLEQVDGEDEILSIGPAVAPGDEVELAEGPLKGTTGEVIEVLSADERVRIFIEFLGRGQTVEVDLFSLLLPRRPVPHQSIEKT
jgi:transcriptional antiterminator RfaH